MIQIHQDGLDIIPDNSTVIKLTIDTLENIENVIKYIDNIPSYDKTLGIESSIKVRDLILSSPIMNDSNPSLLLFPCISTKLLH